MSKPSDMSPATKAIAKQTAISEKIIDPAPALSSAIVQRQILGQQLQQPISPSNCYLQPQSQIIDISSTLDISRNFIYAIAHPMPVNQDTLSAANQFSNTIFSSSELHLIHEPNHLIAHLIETFSSGITLTAYSFEYISDEILSVCKVLHSASEQTQEFVTLEQYNELKTQVDNLKAQVESLKKQVHELQQNTKSASKVSTVFQVITIIMSAIFGILSYQSSVETDRHYEMLEQQNQEIIQHLENIDNTLQSTGQPHYESLDAKQDSFVPRKF